MMDHALSGDLVWAMASFIAARAVVRQYSVTVEEISRSPSSSDMERTSWSLESYEVVDGDKFQVCRWCKLMIFLDCARTKE